MLCLTASRKMCSSRAEGPLRVSLTGAGARDWRDRARPLEACMSYVEETDVIRVERARSGWEEDNSGSKRRSGGVGVATAYEIGCKRVSQYRVYVRCIESCYSSHRILLYLSLYLSVHAPLSGTVPYVPTSRTGDQLLPRWPPQNISPS